MKTYDRSGDTIPSTFYLGFMSELSGQVYGHVDLPSREESAVATYWLGSRERLDALGKETISWTAGSWTHVPPSFGIYFRHYTDSVLPVRNYETHKITNFASYK